MSFFRDASPRKAGSDLIAVLSERRSDRWFVWMAACLPPAAIFFLVNNDVNKLGADKDVEIIYFESWPATRTREESLASNRERQVLKDANRAQQRAAYKALGRAAGLDVDRMEREALETEAERKAIQEAAIAKSLEADTRTPGAAK